MDFQFQLDCLQFRSVDFSPRFTSLAKLMMRMTGCVLSEKPAARTSFQWAPELLYLLYAAIAGYPACELDFRRSCGFRCNCPRIAFVILDVAIYQSTKEISSTDACCLSGGFDFACHQLCAFSYRRHS